MTPENLLSLKHKDCIERENGYRDNPLNNLCCKQKRIRNVTFLILNIVRRMRLELTRSCDHYPLKVACIPISPPAHKNRNTKIENFNISTKYSKIKSPLCPEQDSNLHASRHTHLKRTRLPIPPPGQAFQPVSHNKFFH